MDKLVCFIYTETTGLHQSNILSKKNLYCFARLVVLNYEIGYFENKKFISKKKVRHIIKPRCMNIPVNSIQFHNITQDFAITNGKDIELVIKEFKEDIKIVDILVSHNIDFHLKTILSETIRYNILLDFTKYIIIDTISFFHKYGFIKLKDLFDKLSIKKDNKINDITLTEKKTDIILYKSIDMIRLVFFKLYSQYKKSINNIS